MTLAIATRNRPAGLVRCLSACLSGHALPAEILVIDQSDSDETGRAVSCMAGSAPVPVKHVPQQERGLSRSRNAAVALASHCIVAVTDDDCVPRPEWIAALHAAFSTEPRPDAVTGRVLPLGEAEPGTFAASTRMATRRQDFLGAPPPWDVGTGGNFAARRDLLMQVGGFDTRLGAGSAGAAGEDIELFHRLLRAGARIRFEPDAVVLHERKSDAERVHTRLGYGRGIGALCGMLLRRGDVQAPTILSQWVAMRGRRAGSALLRRDFARFQDEVAVARGTVAGFIYGWATARTSRERGEKGGTGS